MLGLLVFLSAFPASGQVLEISPKIVDSSDQVESRLKENAGHASTTIEGNGAALRVRYFASDPVDFFMVPQNRDGGYVPTDFITFTLPSTEAGETRIDLTVSPGWRPGQITWLVNLLSKDETTEAGFSSMEFEQAGILDTVSAVFTHLLTPEGYAPNVYHALRGYRMLGVSVTVMAGIVLFVAALCVAFFFPVGRKSTAVLTLVVAVTCLYQLRFGIDLLRFTSEHMKGYAAGIYDEAGSIYDVAADVRAMTEGQSLYVCRDGTNFKEKLLRYFVYPTPVESDNADGSTASLVLVMDKFDWSVETRTEDGRTVQSLSCGAFRGDTERLKQYEDGAVLFRIHR